VEKDQTITTTKTTKQQTTNNINKQVPFTFFTHNGIRCMVHIPHSFEMYMQCRSKKIISRSIKLYTIPSTYMYLHQHAHLTLPHLTFSFSPYPYLPNNTFPYPHSLTHSLWLYLASLHLPTYLPTHLSYRTQVYLAFNVLLFLFLCLPCIIYIHTYILSFLPAQPTSRYVGTHLPYLSTFPTYQPSPAVCPPACLSYPVCCMCVVCWQWRRRRKEYFV